MKKYYFMSGLPRAGSTLLSAILNQNPRFYSGPSSPVVSTMVALENHLSSEELYLAYPKPNQGARIIASVLENYYSDIENPVIIDKNRSWVNRLNYIPGYFGIEPKVLCPVRDIKDILASFIAMRRRSVYNINSTKINFIDEMLIKANIPLTDDNRCQFLASDMGIVGQSYNGIKQAIMEGHERNLHFIEYEDLINTPEQTIQKIYDFLEEDYFQHNFNQIENNFRENDEQIYGMADMHEVRKSLGRREIVAEEILSQDILQKCNGSEFWRGMNDPIPTDDYDANYLSDSDDYFNTAIIGDKSVR